MEPHNPNPHPPPPNVLGSSEENHPAATEASRYGLTLPYLFKFPLEDLEHIEDSEYHSPGEYIRYPNKTHETVKRFLKQVRESGGYDVDCTPPLMFNSPFTPQANPGRFDKLALFAIEKINAEKEGRNFKFVDLVHVVGAGTGLVFLTFTVKADASAPVQTLRALLDDPIDGEIGLEFIEWRHKPDPAATSGA